MLFHAKSSTASLLYEGGSYQARLPRGSARINSRECGNRKECSPYIIFSRDQLVYFGISVL